MFLALLLLCLTACAEKQDEVTRLPSILAPDTGAAEPSEPAPPEAPEPPAPAEPEPEEPGPAPGEFEPEPELEPEEIEPEPEDVTPEEELLLEPEAETPPESGIDLAGLQTALEEELATCTGQWALYWECLETGETISLGDGPMVAASLIKLFVAGAWYEAEEQGRVEPSPELVRAMISESSNEACNELIDRLGGGDAAAGMAAVNEFAAALGCGDTALNRKMLAPSPPENYTSAADCAAVLARIWAGDYVSPAASSALLEYLEAQTRTWKIPAGLPGGTRSANKTGELAGVENDAAIVWAPGCTYVLCVLSDGILSPAAGQGNIAGLSRIVYDFVDAAAAP